MSIFIAILLTALVLVTWAILEFVNAAAFELGRFAVVFITHAPVRHRHLSFVDRLMTIPEVVLIRFLLVGAVVAIWTYVP